MGRKKSSKRKADDVVQNRATSPEFPILLSMLLLITVGINGAAVMVIELLGSRVLAPVFGMSLYIWTALISVTLLSLAVGYSVGGVIADRFPNKYYLLFLGIAAVSGWLVLIVFVKSIVLNAFASMGPRGGPIVVSLVLFAFPLAVLAMTPPLAVRYLTGNLGRVGITVGKVSAISTVGSLVGTVATGFYLIPEVGVWKTMWCMAVLLLVLAVAGCVATGVKHSSFFTLIIGLAALAGYPERVKPYLPAPQEFVDARSSAYADIRVINYGKLRFMFIGHGLHTLDFQNGKFPSLQKRAPLYWDALRLYGLFRGKPKNCLLIGLGGGVMYRFVRSRGVADVDVVEIDQVVVNLAREYFHCKIPADKLFVEDARQYAKQCTKKYDLIIMDAFGAGTAPYHLFSEEALREYESLLTKDGVLFSNYIGTVEGEMSSCLASIACTLQDAFPYNIMVAPVPGENNNFIFFSSPASLAVSESALGKICANDRFFLKKLLENHRTLGQKVPPRLEKILGSGKKLDATDCRRLRICLDKTLDVSSLVMRNKGKKITDERNSLEVLNIEQNDHLRKNTLRDFKELFLSGYN